MNFAIREIKSDSLFAVIPIRAKKNEEELAVAMLWDAIDCHYNPYRFEYCRLSTDDMGEAGKWKKPGEWKKFDKKASEYQDILEGN